MKFDLGACSHAPGGSSLWAQITICNTYVKGDRGQEFSFLFQFCDVAKLAIIHINILPNLAIDQIL
jgi:hypothetical protein